MERFGFVGLPNAGKSSLYNALAGGGALAAPYAFATTDPNIGVANVPDKRLFLLGDMSDSKKIVPTTIQFTDIGGLVEGAAKGEGLGNRFLAGIREVDAIVFVLRAFPDPDVPGPVDPVEHLKVVEIELALADLETIQKQLVKIEKAAKADKSANQILEVSKHAIKQLDQGVPIYKSDLTNEEREVLAEFFLLTDKPVLAVVNMGEEQIENANHHLEPVKEELPEQEVIGMCVQLESEAALLQPEEPFREGSSASECAGRIHTDFQKGFIRAETIGWQSLLEQGSWLKARESGLVRSEGKEYKPADGDVMEFRFNV